MVMVNGLSPKTYMPVLMNTNIWAPYYIDSYLLNGMAGMKQLQLPKDVPDTYWNVMQQIWMLRPIKKVFNAGVMKTSLRQRHGILEKHIAALDREGCKTK